MCGTRLAGRSSIDGSVQTGLAGLRVSRWHALSSKRVSRRKQVAGSASGRPFCPQRWVAVAVSEPYRRRFG